MIREHAFNSRWSGRRAGIVADPTLFERAPAEVRAALAGWDWVEARGTPDARGAARIAAAGFVQVDVQVRFRIGLAALPTSPSLARVDVRFADQQPFEVAVDDLADFEHERFLALPGIEAADVNRRYALWSADLLDADPAHGLAVLADGEVQGWFLGRGTEKGLELTLAMLRRGARISGHLLYHRALVAYRERGARIGFASFSVTNTAVHNIYASLGARFLAPEGCWMWSAAGFGGPTPPAR